MSLLGTVLCCPVFMWCDPVFMAACRVLVLRSRSPLNVQRIANFARYIWVNRICGGPCKFFRFLIMALYSWNRLFSRSGPL